MSDPWKLGDEVPLQHKVFDYATGDLAAATVVLTVTDPDGNETTPSISTPSTGIYQALVPTTLVGHWTYAWFVDGAVPDDGEDGSFDVAEFVPPLYVDLDTFRSSVDRSDADTTRDGYLYACLSASSRGIDDYCGRVFYRDPTATARTFRTRGRVDASDSDGELLLLDDIATDDGLIVEVGDTTFTTLTATSYDLEPSTALVRRRPATGLRRVAGRWSRNRLVRVTAAWGWPAIPAQVVQATQIQAKRLYKRRDSPEGVLGNSEWGVVRLSRVDPDVQALLAPFVLPVVG